VWHFVNSLFEIKRIFELWLHSCDLDRARLSTAEKKPTVVLRRRLLHFSRKIACLLHFSRRVLLSFDWMKNSQFLSYSNQTIAK
jgi:hypothetical protein